MNIILGASGQVGSNIVKELISHNLPVRAVIRSRNPGFDSQVEIRTADLFNPEQLTDALEGGNTVFLLTPEDPASNDIIGETQQIINNYKQAIHANGIKRVVGLSCIGAHVEANTGNVLMSRMLEQGFADLDIEKIFIRPSYYFSNWLGFLETVEQYGVLPTFFPEDLEVDMNSPIDVATFIAKVIAHKSRSSDVFELVGPQKYSSRQVAETFSKLLDKHVELQPVPKEKWNETLASAGFTASTTANLVDMTQAVIDDIVVPENPDAVCLPTTLYQYLKEKLEK
ncbi:putative nucleoside-diphosphate-sugar epimerase [Fulvivirga imtechensis AK7]|uniref:Putative nucleoside-diphosphate-sugar epimerase n=1 Tax=Fulvivirga imtechensis AK7 TaxID=1237149 RepID=L8JV50_9BACT|nr:NAD(P)H-binding protein [Fulvivirga imtechensis]ELR71137.1 putative nucleoside-diphosphate-sugar epimerase [Fulvivirga imtechensis AK7]